ncbi:hypothetical protein E3N88_39801 [Mikania micrantha]|uniref:Uncharacterized protein n=1 Tax=Mikania micrantha TaxID=192012 RepID=A0A5N6LKW0_9ASTR|nr:hypothetical protein E3N88_39801 [Mikania micrantha]
MYRAYVEPKLSRHPTTPSVIHEDVLNGNQTSSHMYLSSTQHDETDPRHWRLVRPMLPSMLPSVDPRQRMVNDSKGAYLRIPQRILDVFVVWTQALVNYPRQIPCKVCCLFDVGFP